MCDCEFDHDPEEPDEQSTHYLRVCLHCGGKWWGLHCPHDLIQNPCALCGVVPRPVAEDAG